MISIDWVWSGITHSIRFVADFSRASRPVITVSTDDPVLEPYLSFLLELKWPEGRVLREYTVFLDLPPRRSSQSSSNSTGRGLQPFGEVSVDQYRVAHNDTLGRYSCCSEALRTYN